VGWGYRFGVHIRFDVPADPTYPGRVAAVLSRARLRKHGYVGAVLVTVGALGLALWRGSDRGGEILPLWTASVVGGLLLMLYPPWVRLRARRRSSRYAVEGGYDINDDNIMMRSGTQSSGIAWDGVARVVDTPEFWIVYVGRMPVTVIPRRFMSAEDDQILGTFIAERGLFNAA
jgi:hypothetical protein